MRKMKGPTWRDMIIPLGMVGGGIAGLLAATYLAGTSEPQVMSAGDPGDAFAMLAVFIMRAGIPAGTVIGVIVALALYLKRRRETKYK